MAQTIISEENNPFFVKEQPKPQQGMRIINLLQTFVIFIFVLIFIYLFVATPNQVDGNSMFPTFHDREVVLTYRMVGVLGNTPIGKALGLGYKYGDVIVFQKPGLNEFIKRVIGLPGDRVRVEGGKVFINGEVVPEAYLGPDVSTNAGDHLSEGIELVVPDNSVAAFGDNRPGSYDSRFQGVGFVDMTWIKGRVLIRLWPMNKFGITQHANYVYQYDPADADGPTSRL